jgi:hypothetical protein
VPEDHPFIQRAARNLRAKVRSGEITAGYHSVYNLGLGLVFLSVLKDKDTARPALKQLLAFQRPHGGFASDSGAKEGGDTSMTQYAVLGMWEAEQLGVGAPARAWQGVTTWLMDTQTEGGTFVYNPNRGVLPSLEPHSMTVAGVGSLYIAANMIRARGSPAGRTGAKKGDGAKSEAGEVPSVLVPLGPKKEPGQGKAAQEKAAQEKAASGPITIDRARLDGAISRGDAWIEKNFSVPLRGQWTLYYLYGVERYQAFREKWEGGGYDGGDWYTRGATYLLGSQGGDGSWFGDYNHQVSTSFALLFLVRGTKKGLAAVEDKAGGTLLSGSGLPPDLTNIRIKDGQVVVKPLAGPAGEMLDIMEKPDDPHFLAAVEAFGELVVKADDIMLSPHLVRLRKLARSDSPEARAKAVAALGKSRDLDSVPTLIFALRDDDASVVRAAWDGLRFVSRRFDTFGLSAEFHGNDRERELARAKAIERWQQWYKTVLPDAEFEE